MEAAMLKTLQKILDTRLWVRHIDDERGDGNSIIVTLDNEEAEIKVGQQVPFVTGQFTNTGSASVGTVNPFQTIQSRLQDVSECLITRQLLGLCWQNFSR